ncbi:hemagglutinin repeat-containing protein [Leptotrichia wadei]|uniref:Pre-toxin TG domain-containing protein n=1 Tax=Leptotrichia wadei (strain F0279) TaxID=888055 RepID=U2Q0H3_LEPWF|nr:hemagglutinin repeat-containing protein [Leptotrichia wadei]ERK49851.1 hypothetical protein HMPREF9015_01250 [Leptotrichia wadei F0279]
MSLSGEDKFGKGNNNYTKYGATEHLGGEVTANSTSGRIGDLNLTGSAFIGGDTQGLKIGKVNVESAVNSYDLESKQTSKNTVSKSSTYIKSHQEENVAGNLQLSGARIEGNLTGIGSNIDLGENTFVGGKLTTDSRELHNSFYEKNTSRGFSAGISHGTASFNYGKSSSTYDEKDTINAKSNLRIGDGSVLNNGAEITATNFEYGNIQINNGDVKYGARIDTRDVKTTSRSSNFGVSIGINSPIKDRIEQAAGAVKQARRGDTIGGLVAGVNAGTGMVSGLAGNQGTRQAYHTGNLSQSEVRNASANNNFYANIGVNAGYSTSKNSNNSHNESAVVTTMKPMNENSSITYNNVKNITYQGTQAQGGTFIYNNVKNIRKEAVELHNSSSSRSSNFGISTRATIGYGYGTQITGNGGSVSASRSNQNTTETIYQNGNFQNVNEVHNNTGTMTLSGFNQEGGKVTGNIGKLVVESRQNTSTTTGNSSGMSLGISANGVPSSLNVDGSRTNGSRAFVDNQSSFIVGEGSNLHVGTVENTGAIIGKQSENGTTFKVDKYVGHDIQNYDTMTTTGVSVGTSLGKSPRVTNIGFNQDDRDKQGITRNTVVGNVEIGEASGSPINRDVTKANEVTKDVQHSTNVNVESQTIEYATNPGKLKEDLNKAKDEIKDVTKALDNSIHDPGDDNRNFFGQLRETRLSETVNNIAGERLKVAQTRKEIASAFEEAYSDLGYKNVRVIFTTPEHASQLIDENGKPKAGTAYINKKTGEKTIFINENAEENQTKTGLIGVIAEEGSHIINGVEGRQIETGTEEKGLESTGRATNEYFQEKYKDDADKLIIHKSDGIDYSGIDFGENVGNGKGKEITSTFLDFVPYVGTAKGFAEGITGRDLVTGEKIDLFSRVMGIIPGAKAVGKGTKATVKGIKAAGKIIKNSKKIKVVLSDGSKITLKSDEVTKFEKQAKEAKIKNKGNSSKPSTEMIVRRGHFNGEYKPSPKHKGPKMPPNASPDSIPDIKTGNDLLKNHSYNSATKKQRFAIYKGKMIIFQPTGGTKNEWHAYEITENLRKHVPNDTLKQMLKDGKITKVQYNKNRMK